MFEAVELGRKVPKKEFNAKVPELRTELLHVQEALRETDIPVVVIVSGVEGAGKAEVVNRLNEWLDTRGIQTHAFWDETDEERQRPTYWRFWRTLPARGTIGIMFGSWYTRPIIERVFDRFDEPRFEAEMKRIEEFERMLTLDGALIIKLWFHLSKDQQYERLKAEGKKAKKKGKKILLSPLTKDFSAKYDRFAMVSEQAIRATDSGQCPWILIESGDTRYRDLTAATAVLNAIRQRIDEHKAAASAKKPKAKPRRPIVDKGSTTVLDTVELSSTYSDKEYRELLDKYQLKLNKLSWAARNKPVSSIAMFEGWDAAGKGGAIRRLTQAMDARLYRVISVAAPTDEERAHHYLWRFWRHVPPAGYVTIYDRSWYGRVLVERVEQFAREDEWQRAYMEINEFERQLSERGIAIAKFWIHISEDEQLRRFKEREKIAYKQYKITEEDWRNREKWPAYTQAIDDMVARTSTAYAPWHLIPGNDKKYARIAVLKAMCKQLEETLDR